MIMVHQRSEENSTPKDEMRTPPYLFNYLDNRFGFDMDIAATEENTLCDTFYDKETDALSNDSSWGETNFGNPPYAKDLIGKFVKKAEEVSINGVTTALLLPVDFSTPWWDYCMNAVEWIRIKGRVKFYDNQGLPSKNSPFFSSAVIVFDGELKSAINGDIVPGQTPTTPLVSTLDITSILPRKVA